MTQLEKVGLSQGLHSVPKKIKSKKKGKKPVSIVW